MFSNGLQTHLINMFIAHASSPGETEDTISWIICFRSSSAWGLLL
jgi:hypothetical protein